MNQNPNREKMNEMTACNMRRGMSGKIESSWGMRSKCKNSKDKTLRAHRKGR